MFNTWCDHLGRQPLLSFASAYFCRAIWCDLLPDLEGDPFQSCSRRRSFFALKLFHLRPQRLDGIEIQTVSWPTGEELDAVFGVPLLGCRRNDA